jgi:small subunit ribosomal protein S20
MANTRQAAKRNRQSAKRQGENNLVKSKTRSAIKAAILAVEKGDQDTIKKTYIQAIRELDKAASKGVIPKNRASRKIGRITHLLQKKAPEALPFKAN